MIGAEPPALEHRPAQADTTVLQVQNLSLPRADQFGVDLMDVQFEVKAGEVVGIAGVSGNGQRAAALSGEDQRADTASVQVAGQNAGRMGPASATL